VDRHDPAVAKVRPILRKFGAVVDALRDPPQRAAEALRAHSPNGLTTFYDTGMERVAEVAGELGVPFHTAEVARRLTEIKLTSEGLRVIEVNGRIGGGVPDMLRLASGVEIVKLAMRAALGLPSEVEGLPAVSGVAYRFFSLGLARPIAVHVDYLPLQRTSLVIFVGPGSFRLQ
jgi:hypothetical protein